MTCLEISICSGVIAIPVLVEVLLNPWIKGDKA